MLRDLKGEDMQRNNCGREKERETTGFAQTRLAFWPNDVRPDQLGDEVRAELLNLLKLLNAEIPGKLQAGGLGPYL